MTEVVIETNSGDSGTPVESTVATADLAEALADAQVEAAHELQAEAELDQAQATAEAAIETAIDAIVEVGSHQHPEYVQDHSALYERVTSLEAWRAELDAPEEESIIEVEQAAPSTAASSESSSSEAPKKRHSFGGR